MGPVTTDSHPQRVHPKEGDAPASIFRFALNQVLAVTVSGEQGTCIARSEHATSEPQYLLRYKAADGRAVEAWWGESALSAIEWVGVDLASAKAGPAEFSPPPHPSRIAPICRDCEHVEPRWQQACQHPSQPRYPDDGRSMVGCKSARTDRDRCLKEGLSYCGPEGRLFRPAKAA